MKKRQTYNVLWTGGLDSTFRIAELSLHECIIQPYYVIDKVRPSNQIEVNTMRKIADCIRDRKETKAQLNDVILIEESTIQADETITASWKALKKKYSIGTQYDWLSRYAKSKDMRLEMGLESSSRSKSANAIIGEGTLLKNDNECPAYYIDTSKSSKELNDVFGRFLYPVSLWEKTKEQEIEWYKENGLFEIAKMTWFCFDPVCGYPCGYCNPCKDALNEGMAWRVPFMGRLLGTLRRYFVRGVKKALGLHGKKK